MTNLDRARAYVAKMPPAILGQGGHDATFAVAKVLIHNFALCEAEAWPILLDYNERCEPPWNYGELQHKMSSAGKLTRACKPKGHLLDTEGAWCMQKHFPSAPKSEWSYWDVRIEPLPGKKSPTDPQPEKPEIEELKRQTPAEPLGKPSLVAKEDIEANRIAGELRKLDEAGALREPGDKLFFASVIRALGGTFLPQGAQNAARTTDDTATRWGARILTGSAQPRTRQECEAFLMAAFEPGDVFDLSNPDDAEEYKRLYQPIKRTKTKRPSREGPGYREGNN
jgi:hypothetical protein